ncbi:FICD family protein [Megaselia abdita]
MTRITDIHQCISCKMQTTAALNTLLFICGVLSSIIVFVVINSNWHIFRQTSKLVYIPEETFLQARDDYSLYSTVQSAFRGGRRTKRGTDDVEKKDSYENTMEALSSLKMAEEMKAAGKFDKALKIYKHALALAPRNPEVLIKFGEYLEHNQRDIVLADQYYYQVLNLNPENSVAMENRQRTAHKVERMDQERLNSLDEKREALSSVSRTNAALRRATKEAYFQHIYHSVGIEGNTMTLAQTRSILETRMAVDGKSIDEHNEILGMDLAMKYINATLVNENDYVSMKDILEIHRRVLGHVDPIEGGEFRRTQVYVGGHIPPGPSDLTILMQRFEQWLNSDNVAGMHPVKYAALAHYKLVHIHPFIDGNGRTSRLLMNLILMRAGYPPAIIPKQQRHNYYNYLQLANEGDIRPFVRFIADCTERTLDIYLWATSDMQNRIPLLELEQSHFSIMNTEYSVLSNDMESGSGANSQSES